VNARQVGAFTPLHAVAQTGDAEMAELLLSFAADINARTSEGDTALSIAIEWGHRDVAILLREHRDAA
jgi:ankyrin repeat protein